MYLVNTDTGETLTVFDGEHTLGDIVRWIMESRVDAEEVYAMLGEALAKPDSGVTT